jgi:hypothetical protein
VLGKDSPARKTAQQMFEKMQADPSKPPELDMIGKLNMLSFEKRASHADAIRIVDKAMQEDPELRHKLSGNMNPELSRQFRLALEANGISDAIVGNISKQSFIEPLLAKGSFGADELLQLKNVLKRSEFGKTMLNMSPEALRAINDNPEQREKLLARLNEEDRKVVANILNNGARVAHRKEEVLGRIAEADRQAVKTIINQGGVKSDADRKLIEKIGKENKHAVETLLRELKEGPAKPADQMRMFVLGMGITADQVKDVLSAMTLEGRREVVGEYAHKYGLRDLRKDLRDKAESSDKEQMELLTRTSALSADLKFQIALEKAIASDGWSSSLMKHYHGGALTEMRANLGDFQAAVGAASKRGQELDARTADRLEANFREALVNFRESKEQFADSVANAVITTAALAAAPFTGGASLTPLLVAAGAGATIKLGAHMLASGSDFDFSPGNIAQKGFSGAIGGTAAVINPGHLGALAGKAGLIGRNAASEAAANASKLVGELGKKGEEFLAQELKGAVGQALATRQQGVTAKELEAIADRAIREKIIKPEAKEALMKAMSQGLEKAIEAETRGIIKQAVYEAGHGLANAGIGASAAVAETAVDQAFHGKFSLSELAKAGGEGGAGGLAMSTFGRMFHAAGGAKLDRAAKNMSEDASPFAKYALKGAQISYGVTSAVGAGALGDLTTQAGLHGDVSFGRIAESSLHLGLGSGLGNVGSHLKPRSGHTAPAARPERSAEADRPFGEKAPQARPAETAMVDTMEGKFGVKTGTEQPRLELTAPSAEVTSGKERPLGEMLHEARLLTERRAELTHSPENLPRIKELNEQINRNLNEQIVGSEKKIQELQEKQPRLEPGSKEYRQLEALIREQSDAQMALYEKQSAEFASQRAKLIEQQRNGGKVEQSEIDALSQQISFNLSKRMGLTSERIAETDAGWRQEIQKRESQRELIKDDIDALIHEKFPNNKNLRDLNKLSAREKAELAELKKQEAEINSELKTIARLMKAHGVEAELTKLDNYMRKLEIAQAAERGELTPTIGVARFKLDTETGHLSTAEPGDAAGYRFREHKAGGEGTAVHIEGTGVKLEDANAAVLQSGKLPQSTRQEGFSVTNRPDAPSGEQTGGRVMVNTARPANEKLDKPTAIARVVKHEVGHSIQKEYFDNLPAEKREKVNAAYDRWLSRPETETMLKGKLTPADMAELKGREYVSDKGDKTGYFACFPEQFAEMRALHEFSKLPENKGKTYDQLLSEYTEKSNNPQRAAVMRGAEELYSELKKECFQPFDQAQAKRESLVADAAKQQQRDRATMRDTAEEQKSGTTSVEDLIKQAAETKDSTVAREAIKKAAELGGPQHFPNLLDLARSAKDPQVALDAIKAANSLGAHQHARDQLIELSKRPETAADKNFAIAVMQALAETHPDGKISDRTLRAVAEGDSEVSKLAKAELNKRDAQYAAEARQEIDTRNKVQAEKDAVQQKLKEEQERAKAEEAKRTAAEEARWKAASRPPVDERLSNALPLSAESAMKAREAIEFLARSGQPGHAHQLADFARSLDLSKPDQKQLALTAIEAASKLGERHRESGRSLVRDPAAAQDMLDLVKLRGDKDVAAAALKAAGALGDIQHMPQFLDIARSFMNKETNGNAELKAKNQELALEALRQAAKVGGPRSASSLMLELAKSVNDEKLAGKVMQAISEANSIGRIPNSTLDKLANGDSAVAKLAKTELGKREAQYAAEAKQERDAQNKVQAEKDAEQQRLQEEQKRAKAEEAERKSAQEARWQAASRPPIDERLRTRPLSVESTEKAWQAINYLAANGQPGHAHQLADFARSLDLSKPGQKQLALAAIEVAANLGERHRQSGRSLVSDPSAAQAMIDLVKTTGDKDVAAAALKAAGSLGDIQHMPQFLDVARSLLTRETGGNAEQKARNQELALDALRQVTKLGGPQNARSILLELAKSVHDEKLAGKVMQAIADTNGNGRISNSTLDKLANGDSAVAKLAKAENEAREKQYLAETQQKLTELKRERADLERAKQLKETEVELRKASEAARTKAIAEAQEKLEAATRPAINKHLFPVSPEKPLSIEGATAALATLGKDGTPAHIHQIGEFLKSLDLSKPEQLKLLQEGLKAAHQIAERDLRDNPQMQVKNPKPANEMLELANKLSSPELQGKALRIAGMLGDISHLEPLLAVANKAGIDQKVKLEALRAADRLGGHAHAREGMLKLAEFVTDPVLANDLMTSLRQTYNNNKIHGRDLEALSQVTSPVGELATRELANREAARRGQTQETGTALQAVPVKPDIIETNKGRVDPSGHLRPGHEYQDGRTGIRIKIEGTEPVPQQVVVDCLKAAEKLLQSHSIRPSELVFKHDPQDTAIGRASDYRVTMNTDKLAGENIEFIYFHETGHIVDRQYYSKFASEAQQKPFQEQLARDIQSPEMKNAIQESYSSLAPTEIAPLQKLLSDLCPRRNDPGRFDGTQPGEVMLYKLARNEVYAEAQRLYQLKKEAIGRGENPSYKDLALKNPIGTDMDRARMMSALEKTFQLLEDNVFKPIEAERIVARRRAFAAQEAGGLPSTSLDLMVAKFEARTKNKTADQDLVDETKHIKGFNSDLYKETRVD